MVTADDATLGSRRTSGFTLVGIVVAIAIITILIAAVGPTISTIIEREREKELIFRGKQYARGIIAFQKRYGRLPNKLEEMAKMKPHTIRHLWTDPMCGCDDWQVIIVGSPEAAPMGQGPLPGGGSGPSTTRTPGFGTSMFQTTPTPAPFLGGGGGGRTPTPTSIFGTPGQVVGPIIGVRSKVRRQAVSQWRGRDFTDEWRFIAGDADNDQPQIGAPGGGISLTPRANSTTGMH
jgi:type II secretory pathway pseudopilin PulG